ncbi:MAG: DUF6655 family protein [Planctomycetota bacterium]
MRTLLLTHSLFAALFAVSLVATGCVGGIRDTTSPRAAHEMLLVSTAADRAVKKYDVSGLKGKRVFVDDARFESMDKPYALSALRDHLAAAGVILTPKKDPVDAKTPDGADIVLEIRSAALGIWDGDFTLGVPPLPFAAQGLPAVQLPPLYVFRRFSQQGYAKFRFWLYDAATLAYLGRSPELWGHSYYNRWWWFGIGPFDGSNDIYPELTSVGDDGDEKVSDGKK